ncbi:MAG: hypothetical protein ACK46R_03105, partial [Bacteroidota bacterium]
MDSIPTKSLNKKSVTGIKREARTDNSTLAIGGVSCSADSLVVAESSVLRTTSVLKSPPIANLQNVRRQAKNNISDNYFVKEKLQLVII